MDISGIDDKQRKIALETFQSALTVEESLMTEDKNAYYAMAINYLNAIRVCFDRRDKIDAIRGLISQFGGEASSSDGRFSIVDITNENYYSLMDEIEGRVPATDSSTSLEKAVEASESSEEDFEEDDSNTQRTPRRRGIKKRVIRLLSESSELLNTGDIVETIRREFGDDTPYQSITNTLIRLQNDNVIVRDSAGNWGLRDSDVENESIAEDEKFDDYFVLSEKNTDNSTETKIGMNFIE